MKLRLQLLQTILVQGVGAGAALFAVLLLGSFLGPEPQGLFSRVKVEVEFCAALAMFGMPQALFYFVKTARLNLRVALRWASYAPVAGAVVALCYALASHGHSDGTSLALWCAAVACCTWHGVLRGLTLVQPTILQFNIITSLPQVLMLLLALALVLRHESVAPETLSAGFTLLFAASAGVAFRPLLALARTHPSPPGASSMSALLRYGLAAWLTVSLTAAGLVLIQRGVESTLGGTALGIFTMAMALAQVPLTPINYALPVLFRHWVQQGSAGLPWRILSVCTGGLLISAAIVGGLSSIKPDLWLGSRYTGLAALLSLLLAGAAGEALLKIISVDCHAQAALRPPILAEAARCTVVVVWWVISPWSHLFEAGLTWAVAAWCAVAVLGASRRMGAQI